jgi:hypothetical protein
MACSPSVASRLPERAALGARPQGRHGSAPPPGLRWPRVTAAMICASATFSLEAARAPGVARGLNDMTEETERGRFFGLPAREGGWLPEASDTEPRILGVPQSWVGFGRDPKRDIDMRWLKHPLRWSRWRREVRRRGPYAPTYEDFPADAPKDGQ